MSSVYASVDLGGTNIKCIVATGEGEILGSKSVPTQSHEGPERVVERIGDLVCGLANELELQPQAVGIAAPGLVDRARSMTKFFPNFPTQWRDVPIRDLLSPRVRCPVYLLNDVRTAALGELTFGHGRHAGTMAFFSLGTGIGGAVAVDGRLRLGPLGAAGELGHQTILPDGPRCGCGNRGCLETLAAGPAIAAEGVRLMLSGLAPKLYELVEGDPGRVTTKEMAAAAAAGDANVAEAIERAAEYLGIGVANVVVVLHPDLVVLGGGVAQMGDLLINTVRRVVSQRVGMFPTDGVRVCASALGDRAGALGGIALAMQGGLLDD
jgi:glucokinase